jgi:hypothetical protein
MRSPRLFSFLLSNQSNRPSQGRAKQTCSSTGSTIMTTAVKLRKPEVQFPSRTLPGSSRPLALQTRSHTPRYRRGYLERAVRNVLLPAVDAEVGEDAPGY